MCMLTGELQENKKINTPIFNVFHFNLTFFFIIHVKCNKPRKSVPYVDHSVFNCIRTAHHKAKAKCSGHYEVFFFYDGAYEMAIIKINKI